MDMLASDFTGKYIIHIPHISEEILKIQRKSLINMKNMLEVMNHLYVITVINNNHRYVVAYIDCVL